MACRLGSASSFKALRQDQAKQHDVTWLLSSLRSNKNIDHWHENAVYPHFHPTEVVSAHEGPFSSLLYLRMWLSVLSPLGLGKYLCYIFSICFLSLCGWGCISPRTKRPFNNHLLSPSAIQEEVSLHSYHKSIVRKKGLLSLMVEWLQLGGNR